MYGESDGRDRAGARSRGLSPRVRGIHALHASSLQQSGSIPACTGNPVVNTVCAHFLWVYPRVYGESHQEVCIMANGPGLSPRVRGIPGGGHQGRAEHGSIPACTGNPARHLGGAGDCRVYPRVYGESLLDETGHPGDAGLSPRVRGIRVQVWADGLDQGSIPACTGNPAGSTTISAHRRVYPRVYGESQSGGENRIV